MKIMLDAGHGFTTPGKRSPDGLKEYEFNRKTAYFAKEQLENYQNVVVFFAHSDDRDVSLQERTNLANRLLVNVFVSIHANAFGTDWNDAGGIETYVYLSKPKEAIELAEKIQSCLTAMTGLKNRGVKTADYHVLRESSMTAVLAECGFMTNRTEAGLLRTDAYQKTCAEAIVKALAEQFHLTPKQNMSPSPNPAAGLFKVQIGAFADKNNADRLAAKLKNAGFAAITSYEPPTSTSIGLYKVQAGAFSEKSRAEAFLQQLKTRGFDAFIFAETKK